MHRRDGAGVIVDSAYLTMKTTFPGYVVSRIDEDLGKRMVVGPGEEGKMVIMQAELRPTASSDLSCIGTGRSGVHSTSGLPDLTCTFIKGSPCSSPHISLLNSTC